MTYSQSHHKMCEQGHLAETLNGRKPGTSLYLDIADPDVLKLFEKQKITPVAGVYCIAPGVVDNGDGTYSPNQKLVTLESYYKEYYRIGNVETNTFSTTYLKLREVRLDSSTMLQWVYMGAICFALPVIQCMTRRQPHLMAIHLYQV